DCGLGCQDPRRVAVTAPGAWMSNWLASVGSLGAFLTFAVSLCGSLDKAVALTTTLFASLLPSCILAPTLFYRRVEPGILVKVRESKTAIAMARLFAPPSSPSAPPSYPPSSPTLPGTRLAPPDKDRKSTRLNSSHGSISY